MVKTEANKELLRRQFEAMEEGRFDEALSEWAPDAVNHGAGRPGQKPPAGREGIGLALRMLHTAFPDRRWEINDMIAEGDRVACRITVSGTFGDKPERPPVPMPPDWTGVEGTELLGPAAEGKPYAIQHIHVFRIVDGKITDHWAARDDLGLLVQLGAISVPQGVEARPT